MKIINKKPEWFEFDKNSSVEKNPPKSFIHIKFDSVVQWYKYLKEYKPEQGTWLSSQKISNDMWSGSRTWDDYLEILDTGDKELMNKIKKETQKQVKIMEKKYEKQIVAYKFDVIGEQFDIGLVLSGVPEVWLEPIEEEVEAPKIELKLNMGTSSRTSFDDIINNASKVLSMLMILDEMGYQTKLTAYTLSVGYDYADSSKCIILENAVKDYDEPINFNKVSVYLSPTHLRRGSFAVREQMADDLNSGYGMTINSKGLVRISEDEQVKELEKKLFGGAK